MRWTEIYWGKSCNVWTLHQRLDLGHCDPGQTGLTVRVGADDAGTRAIRGRLLCRQPGSAARV